MLRNLIILCSIALALAALLRVPPGTWRLSLVLTLSVTLALLTELAGMLLVYLGHTNNLLYNLVVTVEFLLLMWLMDRNRPAWRGWWMTGAGFGLSAMVAVACVHDPTEFLLIEGVLCFSILLSIALVTSLWHLARTSDVALYRVPEFWLFMGMLIYFGGMVPVIGMIRFVFRMDADLAARLYMIVPWLCIVRYLATAFACMLQVRRSAPSRNG